METPETPTETPTAEAPVDHNPQGFDVGDIVLHSLTATEVEVACVQEDKLIKRGWPATEYLVADCTLVTKAPAWKRAAALLDMSKMHNPRDVRCAAARLAVEREGITEADAKEPAEAAAAN